MKKTALATLAFALMLGVNSCSQKETSETTENTTSTDSIVERPRADQGESFAPTTNIRYIDLDKISQEYNLAKDFHETMIRNESDLQLYHQNKSNEIQKLANQIDEKARNNGYLSQQSYEADLRKLQQLQANAEQGMAQKQKEYQQQLEEQTYNIQLNLQNFLVEYNKEHHYDAILYHSAGAYFNPALDITDEVVAGLNKIYNQYHD